jgi:hypothetical protein
MQMGLGRGEPGRNRITRQQVTAMRDGLSKGAYPQGIVIPISRWRPYKRDGLSKGAYPQGIVILVSG